MAEFIFKQMVAQKGVADRFEIASAATDGYNEMCHEGMDYRATEMLRQMKVPFTQHYSRQIRRADYEHFDYILAMDTNNVRDILAIVGKDTAHKVHRLLDFTKNPRSVKDPWYTDNFDEAYWDIYEGCQAFLEYLEKHDL